MLHIPPSIIKKTAVFVTAAIIAMALAACKMDMDESTSGGRIVLALDGETVQSLNNAVRTARAEEPPADSSADTAQQSIPPAYEGTYLDIALTGAVQKTKTIPVQEGISVTFDELPAGVSVQIKGIVWLEDPLLGRIVIAEGISEPIVIKEGDNQATLPLSLLSDSLQESLPSKFLPLTLKALEDGAINISGAWSTLQYTKNDGEMTALASSSIDVSAGDVVCLFAAASENAGNGSTYMNISPSADCAIYGNIMSLLTLSDGEWNPDATELTKRRELAMLFYNSTHIKNHPGKALVMPATTLSELCYSSMFTGCTSLTVAPELPATTLGVQCCDSMFYNCTSLTTAPTILPATTLTNYCYNSMFRNCTSLKNAPDLPATTLTTKCYSQMFDGCSSLTKTPELPATTLAEECYNQMFNKCTSLITASEISATTLAKKCCYEMFNDCTNLTTAPSELPATTLAESCYYNMFNNCKSLIKAPVLPATESATTCYYSMFFGCKALTEITCFITNPGERPGAFSYWNSDTISSSGTLYVKNDTAKTNWESFTYKPSGWIVKVYPGS